MSLELLRSATGRILLESHRDCDSFPENSWLALEAAHRMQADLIEVDVQLSQDGVAFLRHNYNLPDGRCCHSLPWSELGTIKIEGQPFPLLEEVLAWAQDGEVLLSLDLKTGFRPERILCQEINLLIKRTQTVNRVVLIGWDHLELKWLKMEDPEVTTRVLIRARPVDLPSVVRAASADAVSLSYDLIRPSDVQQLHDLGIAVALVEMWQPDFGLARCLDVDLVSWGNPEQARKALADNSNLSLKDTIPIGES